MRERRWYPRRDCMAQVTGFQRGNVVGRLARRVDARDQHRLEFEVVAIGALGRNDFGVRDLGRRFPRRNLVTRFASPGNRGVNGRRRMAGASSARADDFIVIDAKHGIPSGELVARTAIGTGVDVSERHAMATGRTACPGNGRGNQVMVNAVRRAELQYAVATGTIALLHINRDMSGVASCCRNAIVTTATAGARRNLGMVKTQRWYPRRSDMAPRTIVCRGNMIRRFAAGERAVVAANTGYKCAAVVHPCRDDKSVRGMTHVAGLGGWNVAQRFAAR